jgi:predicted  nucleic acid-binding Zn-ribbon protein
MLTPILLSADISGMDQVNLAALRAELALLEAQEAQLFRYATASAKDERKISAKREKLQHRIEELREILSYARSLEREEIA